MNPVSYALDHSHELSVSRNEGCGNSGIKGCEYPVVASREVDQVHVSDLIVPDQGSDIYHRFCQGGIVREKVVAGQSPQSLYWAMSSAVMTWLGTGAKVGKPCGGTGGVDSESRVVVMKTP